MDSQNNNDIFRRTARRAAQRASFIAADLAAYKATQGASEEELANFLSCPVEALTDLALCKRPDPSRSNFKTQVQRIASFVGCDDSRLANLLREVDAINVFRSAAEDGELPAGAGLLAAARDAGDDELEPPHHDVDLGENNENREHQ